MDNISMIIVLFSAFGLGSIVVYIISCDIKVANFSKIVRELYDLNEDICNTISTSNNDFAIPIEDKVFKKVVKEKEFFYIEVSKKDFILDEKIKKIEFLERLEKISQKLIEMSKKIDDFMLYYSNIEKEKDLLQKIKNKITLVKWQIESETDKKLE